MDLKRSIVSCISTCALLTILPIGFASAATYTYQYDSRGQLTRVTDQSDLFESFTYDLAGNIQELTGVDNPSLDSDSDGLADLDEIQLGTNPYDSDSDDDGMPDGWELNYGLDPLADGSGLDPDEDEYTNLDEYLAGTDPTDPGSHP